MLGGKRDATVDRSGVVVAARAPTWELDWWIGADDRWRVPAHEAAVRQQLVDGMPVVQTSMRVPGGDAVQRVVRRAGGDVGEVAVVEIANDSPAPFVAALVVRGASALDLDGASVWADGRSAIRTPRPPSRWAASVDGSTEATVASGAASDGPFAHRQDRAARLVGAFLFPVAHRTSLRAVVTLGTQGIGATEPGALPDADAVARGWRAQLDRGLRVELPDESVATRGRHRGAWRPCSQVRRGAVEPAVAAVLEDWGLDAEAAVAWSRLTGRARRRLARRQPRTATWNEVLARLIAPDAELLAALRAVLVRDLDAGVVMLDDWPRGVDRPTDRRARRADVRGPGLVLGALARRPTGVVVGRSRGHDVHGPRARSRVVVARCPGRGAPRAVQPAGLTSRSVRSSHGRSAARPLNSPSTAPVRFTT